MLRKSIKPLFRHIPPIRAMTHFMRDTPLWGINEINWENEVLEIKGWALPPAGGPEKAGFAVNGTLFEHVDYPLEREDIGRIFWWVPDSLYSGFHCRTTYSRARVTAGMTTTLAYVARKSGHPFTENHNYYYCHDDDLAYPPPEKRRRVQGTENQHIFMLEGHSTYVKLQSTLGKCLGKCYADFPRILDWGCGCGRLARYFKREPLSRLTGLDIDGDNIAWCRENLGFGDFQSIPLHPPTRLADGNFDLVIGISVFTHLAEDVQKEWLAELRCLAAPGAVLLLSVHGLTSFLRTGGLKHLLYFQLSRGFYDIGLCQDLGEFISNPRYYRGAYHSQRYIRGVWSKYFDVLRILPGYIGNNQDLVILRRRD